MRPATHPVGNPWGGWTLLCEPCAVQVQVLGHAPKMMLPALLSPPALPQPQLCPACGLSWDQLNHTSRFGCAECYSAFRAPLSATLTRLHGSTHHAGRRPGAPPSGPDDLRRALESAVAEERYEDAARLRDRLRAAEQEGSP